MIWFLLSSHAITQDVDLIETAKAAKFFMSDGIIVTGTATGQPAKPHDVNGKLLSKIWQDQPFADNSLPSYIIRADI